MKKYLCLFLTVALVSNHGFSQIRSPSDQLSESDNSQGAQINLVIDRQYVQTNPESLIENFRLIILDKLKRNEVDENFLIESSRRFQLETQGRGSDFKILIHKAILKELNEVQSKLKNILDKELGDGLMGIALPLSFLGSVFLGLFLGIPESKKIHKPAWTAWILTILGVTAYFTLTNRQEVSNLNRQVQLLANSIENEIRSLENEQQANRF